jgi:uncharacterized protein YidB (DUF937 family)
MSLLNSIVGAVVNNMGQGQSQPANPLMNIVMGMLTQQSGQGSQGGLGGLAGLAEMFQQKGAGDLMSSWIGTGQNMPISGDQLSGILGSEQIGSIASQLGMSQSETSGALADLLPQVIDRLTPQGQMPQGDISQQLSGMLSGFFNK